MSEIFMQMPEHSILSGGKVREIGVNHYLPACQFVVRFVKNVSQKYQIVEEC